MEKGKSAYAKAGVDYEKIEPFKQAMIEMGKKTLKFPNCWNVYINEEALHAHGAVFSYGGSMSHKWCTVNEGLGNLNWIAEWMYANTGKSYYDVIGRATGLLIGIDVLAQGAVPAVWNDKVSAGDSEWFADEERSRDFAKGCFELCEQDKIALPAGESPAYRYLVKATLPVKSAPVLSGSMTGIIAPSGNLITGEKLGPGDVILGVLSSGLHSNGSTLVIDRVMQLPDQFLTKLPNNRVVGDECLIPIPSYMRLVKALVDSSCDIHAILPGTGDGLGKIAYDKRPYTYRIREWVEVPLLFKFMLEIGVSLYDCLKTFNWGIGMYFFVSHNDVNSAIDVAWKAGYKLVELGVVEEGERKVIFEPENGIELPPPGK